MDFYGLNMVIMEANNLNDKYTKKELIAEISKLKKVNIMSIIRNTKILREKFNLDK